MTMKPVTSRTFTISFPVDLAEKIEKLAADESRTVSELFREAFRIYQAQRALAALDAMNKDAAKRGHNGYGPEDVVRLVREVRTEMAAEREAKKNLEAA